MHVGAHLASQEKHQVYLSDSFEQPEEKEMRKKQKEENEGEKNQTGATVEN